MSASSLQTLPVRESAMPYRTEADGPADGPSNGARTGVPDAGSIHELLRALQGIGNKVRLRFVDALRDVHDGNLHLELGYASFEQYCERELGLRRSTSLEYVRAAKALDRLPRTRVLFGQGELSWDQVRAMTRVATVDTEARWIELAFDETVQVLHAEVREALRTRRDAPRDRRYGLPNILTRMWIDLTLEDKGRVLAAFARVSAALEPGPGDGPGGGSAEGGGSDERPVLARWADGILSGAIPFTPSGDGTRDAAAQTLVYHVCPACRQAALDSDDGPIAISPDRVAELEPVSNLVVLSPDQEVPAEVLPPGVVDAPNTPRLARQVLARDGQVCANPGCNRRGRLHAHHIIERSRGGPTVASNLVTVCDVCHALIHNGLLDVSGNPVTGLTWQPRPLDPAVKVRDAATLRHMLEALDARCAAEESTYRDPAPESTYRDPVPESTYRDPVPESTYRDSAPESTYRDTRPLPPRGVSTARIQELAEAMTSLGCTRADGERRVRAAIGQLMAERAPDGAAHGRLEPLDDAEILLRAIRLDARARG